MTVISVERSGQEIGDYNLEGIKEGLASGYFLPDDYGWYEGLAEWQPLPAIVEMLSAQPVPAPVASTANATRLSATPTRTDSASFYTLFRGRGPAKLTQIIGAQYFYRTQNQTVEGPFNKLEMRGLMRKKIVEPETMVLCPATKQWLPCERFPELPKPAFNKLLHFEKDARFTALVDEIPRMLIDHIADKISETQFASWLVGRIKECGYQCPDWDEGTINDLVCEDRIGIIIRTNRQTWIGYIQYSRGGGSALTNKPVLIGF